MIAEIGHGLLWLALSCAALQAAAAWPRAGIAQLAVPAAILQGWLWLWIAGALLWSFMVTDLSVAGVAASSDAALPTGLKLAAVVVQDCGWLILATALLAWGGAVLAFLRGGARRSICACGAVAALATVTLLAGVQPFARLVPAPTAGAGFPVAARGWLAAASLPGLRRAHASFALGQTIEGVTLVAVTPVAGPDSTGVAAEVRVDGTPVIPEWRETIRPGAAFAVAGSGIGAGGWVAATIRPAAGGRWHVTASQFPLWWAGLGLAGLAGGLWAWRRR